MLNESLADIIFDKDQEGKVLRTCQCGGELSLKVGSLVLLLDVQIIQNANLQAPITYKSSARRLYV